jgi:hypothetical protein
MPASNLSLPFVVAPRSNSCSSGQAALLSLIWLVPGWVAAAPTSDRSGRAIRCRDRCVRTAHCSPCMYPTLLTLVHTSGAVADAGDADDSECPAA